MEILGGESEPSQVEARQALRAVLSRQGLDVLGLGLQLSDVLLPRRDYDTGSTFEVRCAIAGSSIQIAGGRSYREGCGWALGIERLLAAIEAAGGH